MKRVQLASLLLSNILLIGQTMGQVCRYDEYLQGNSQCKKCHQSCITCYGPSELDCFACVGYMHNQKCQSECDDNYFQEESQQICVTCQISFCEKCLNSNQCEKCEQNFMVSQAKDECIYKQTLVNQYAYYDIYKKEVVEAQQCPTFLETSKNTFTCSYPKICSQQNYIGEYNSNCFNLDQDGLRLVVKPNYIYYYTKKEVYIFYSDSYDYVHYLQNLNSDKDIQTIISSNDGDIFIIYDTLVLEYSLGDSQLQIAITMPKSILNNQFTLIQSQIDEIIGGPFLITTSASLQEIYVFDLTMKNIRHSFQIGQKIFQYFIVPEKQQLIIVTLLRISIYKSFFSSESVNLEIGEESQVNWIKSYQQPLKQDSKERIFVFLNGWSILLFNTIDYNLIQIVGESDSGYLLGECNLLAKVSKNIIKFVDVVELMGVCKDDKECLINNPKLILHTIEINAINEYLFESFNNHIYMSIKNSYELYIYNFNFQLISVYSHFYKPIKAIYTYQSIDTQAKKQIVITQDNNAKIFSADNSAQLLFQFCNEQNMEVFNEELKEFGAVVLDELRDILIYAAVSIQGNIVIFMKKENGQALFYKEFVGDEIISSLTMVRKTFKILLHPKKKLIKLFGVMNDKGQHLVITIEYFNFKINSNYEVYHSIDSIISDSIFLAQEKEGEPFCVYSFKIDLEKSYQVTCLTDNFTQIKANALFIAISIRKNLTNENYIAFYFKEQQFAYKEQRVEEDNYFFELLDGQTILILAIAQFYKFKITDIPLQQLQAFPNKLTGQIKQYQIDSSTSWLLLKELRVDLFYFHFFDLLSSDLTQVNNEITPLATYDDTGSVWQQYTGSDCTFLIMQTLYSNTSFFQIISSNFAGIKGEKEIYTNNVVSYVVVSSSEFKSVGQKQIIQFIKADEQYIIEGSYSQSKLLFYNQLNIKEQINVLCSQNCEFTGKIENYQLLYQRWHLPNILKELSVDKIFLSDYYTNTMYSDKWHIIAIESYQNWQKVGITHRIELIQYPEKVMLFTYSIQSLCSLFSFQLVTNYDTLLICDSDKIKVFDLLAITQANKHLSTTINGNTFNLTFLFSLNYPKEQDKMAFFSQIEPQIYFNGYGTYDYLTGNFYPSTELVFYMKGKEGKLQIMETESHLYYCVESFIYLYDKKQITRADLEMQQTIIFLNKNDEIPYLERDFIIGLTQLRESLQVQIFDYQNFNPIKSFYELEQEQFNKDGYYFYCWQYQKLFLRYDSSIVGYDYPFSADQKAFFTYKTKQNTPRACSNSYLVVYEETQDNLIIRFISYTDTSVIKQYSLLKSVQRVSIDLFIKQKNIAIIEAKQIIIIGNILFSTSISDFFFIFQESKFHYSPSLDIAFIHQQALERYIQVLDLSSLFPFIQERFSFESYLNFENYFKQSSSGQPLIQLVSDSTSLQSSNKEQRNTQQLAGNEQNQLPQQGKSEISDDDLIFISLMQESICFYDIQKKNYKLLKLPLLPAEQKLEAKRSHRMQYRILLNVHDNKTLAVVNFDRFFYLYSRDTLVKILSLSEFQEIHLEKEDSQVFIYGLKDERMYYITIDNTAEDFRMKEVDLNELFDLKNYVIIARQFNLRFAMVDNNNKKLIAQESGDSKTCQAINFLDHVRGVRILKLMRQSKSSEDVKLFVIVVYTQETLLLYDFNCELLWQKTQTNGVIQDFLADDSTQQIYFADKYYIYIVLYEDILSKLPSSSIIFARIPLQARHHLKLQKVDMNLLAVLSYSNVYIYSVKESFTAIFYITNKDFAYVKQIFLVDNEFVIISDINSLYIYQILTDENDAITSKLVTSRNSLSGSSSFSSTSSNNSTFYSNQADSSDYYGSQQIAKRKQAALFYTQKNLYIQILSIQIIYNDQRLFVRILGADYNNLIDLTKELKILNNHVRSSIPNQDTSNHSNQSTSFGVYNIDASLSEADLQQASCRGEQVIHRKKSYQIIQYDTLYSQNQGLYNQVTFKYPISQSTDSNDTTPLNDLFIPNSLKLKAKKHSNFIYDLNNNNVILLPEKIISSFISKIKICNGTIQNILDSQQDSNIPQRNLFQNQSNERNLGKRKLNSQPIQNMVIRINNFQEIYLQDIVLKQSLSFTNCTRVILENVSVCLDCGRQVTLEFNMEGNNGQTVIQITNMTVQASIMQKEFMTMKNSQKVNITNLNVIGDAKLWYISSAYLYNSQKWIQILSCYDVLLNKLTFMKTNANLDLFYLQDINNMNIYNVTFSDHNKGFIADLSNAHDDPQREGTPSVNEKGELIFSQIEEQQSLQYFINIPMKANSYSSILKIIYVKNKLDIRDITVERSSLSTFLHFNKTIITDSKSNQSIKEQYESTNLVIAMSNMKISDVSTTQMQECLSSDFIIIEGLDVTLDTILVQDTHCYQSFIRFIACKRVQIHQANFKNIQTINFPLYFFKNDLVLLKSINFFKTQELQHLIGLINTQSAELFDVNVYPTLDAIIHIRDTDTTIAKPITLKEPIIPSVIRNCAFLLYSELNPKDDGNPLVSEISLTLNSITISNSTLQFLNSQKSNGTVIQAYNYKLVELINVRLYNNAAGMNGGAVYLFSSLLHLQNSEIAYNRAQLSGGAIYSLNSDIIIGDDNTNTLNFINLILKTSIHHNSASIGGGIRYFKRNLSILDQNIQQIYQNNATFFGRDYANYPQHFLLRDIEENKHIQSVVSSISTVPTDINFYWVDQQGDRLIYEDKNMNTYLDDIVKKEIEQYTSVYMSSEQIWINRVKSETKILGVVAYDSNNHQYIQTSQSFLLKPKETSLLILKTLVNYPEDESDDLTMREMVQSKAIKLTFRECIEGEVFNLFNPESYECLECKDNTYSLSQPESFDNKCLLCPDEAKKCQKNIIEIYNQYWIQPNTSNIYYCYNSPDKCQPEQKNGCSEGGYGPRCESCDYSGQIWKGKNYARYGRFKCQECGEENISQYIIVVILIIVFGLFQAYLAHKVTLQTQTTLLGHYLKRAGIINLGSSIQGIGSNSLIKFIVGYFQIIQVLTSFNFKFSLGFLNAIYFFGNPLQISQFFLDCLYIQQKWIDNLEIIYIRLIWSIINTFIYLLISVLFSAAYIFIQKHKSQQKKVLFFRFARTSIYYVFYLMFPSLISQLINIISCEQIGGVRYIYGDNQFKCNSKQHMLIGYPIAIPLLVCITLVFPTYIYYKLKNNRHNLYHITFYLKYRFFFCEYKDSSYYWELVKMAQKGFIYIGLSIYNENQIAKGAIVSLIMTIYIKYIYILKPYKRIFLNQIDFAASFTLLICFQIGMINMASSNSSIQSFSFYLILLCNIFFILYFLYMIFKEKIPYHKRMFMFSCIEISIKRFPFLKQYFHRQESLYTSHKAWAKVRSTIKRIGFQNLPLYLPRIQNGNNPSIIYQLGAQKESNNILIQDFPSQKSIGSDPIATKDFLSFQQQVHNPGLRNQLSSYRRSLLSPQIQTHDSDLRTIKRLKLKKSGDQEIILIDSLSCSESLQVADEKIDGGVDKQFETQITTAQKLMSQKNIKLIIPSDKKLIELDNLSNNQ